MSTSHKIFKSRCCGLGRHVLVFMVEQLGIEMTTLKFDLDWFLESVVVVGFDSVMGDLFFSRVHNFIMLPKR